MKQFEIDKVCDSGHMICCFDLDGTLTELECPDDLLDIKPRLDVIAHLKRLHKEGHVIIIHTGRPSNRREVTIQWLKKYNVPYHELHFDKPRAHLYIDDSTINVVDYLKDPSVYERVFLSLGQQINKQWRDKNNELGD